MFKSRRRPVIIPQSEHLKLAGSLAFLWGNGGFDLPPVPPLSFVAGIATHDRGYGYLDTLPVGEAEEVDWLAVTRHGFYLSNSDPVADIIARQHLRRLVDFRHTPERSALAREMDQAIAQQVSQLGLSPAVFQRLDRITDFCDRVSFDFCFEQPTRGEVLVYPRNDSPGQIPVQFRIEGSRISLSPWPLRIDGYSGYILGYQAEGYPDRPNPMIIPYHLSPFEQTTN